MTQDELLKELRDDMYVMLKPSPVHGIGVFAIRDIPKGCRSIFSNHQSEWIKLPIREVEKLPDHSRNLVETYCLFDEENYYVPEYGFKIMDMVNYINHSSTPNIQSINDGEFFEALADIPSGTELLVNYGHIVATEEYD
ncbi:MAG: SET domain-containing protein [Chitinophagaceae bacterium]|nr:SET domain-containing protein [Chitinophagaceae bacterium]